MKAQLPITLKITVLFFFLISASVFAQTTSIPDPNFEQALIDLGYDTLPIDGSVPTANISEITNLDVSFWNISDLTGIEDFVALTALSCDHNNLTSLDISSNTALTFFTCYLNNLTSLDVSNNTALQHLYCNSNNLSNLNVKNDNNLNIPGAQFIAYDNPNLTCIQVDDAAWSTANWTGIDPQSYFSEDCALGISELEQNAFSIYPNPAKNFFKIDSELPVSEVIIYSITGKIVSKFKAQKSYNVSNLRQGMYFIAVKSNNKTGIQKLMID